MKSDEATTRRNFSWELEAADYGRNDSNGKDLNRDAVMDNVRMEEEWMKENVWMKKKLD